MSIKNSVIVPLIVAILVSVGAYAVIPKSKTTVVQQTQAPSRNLGGTQPEFASPYLTVNGVTKWYFSSQMKAGTSTVCSFVVPTGTSSIEWINWGFPVSTSSAFSIDVATSTGPTGTSSPNAPFGVLFSTTVSASNPQSGRWVPPGGSVQNSVVYGVSSTTAPVATQYLNFVVAGSNRIDLNGTFASSTSNSIVPGGHCEAIFDQM